jgi:hypothetical protein
MKLFRNDSAAFLAFLIAISSFWFSPVGKSQTFVTNTPASTQRFQAAATLLPDGRAMVIAGSNNTNFLASTEFFDPTNGTWSFGPSLSLARQSLTATLLPNGKILVAGGLNTFPNVGGPVSLAELYDPASGATAGNMTCRRAAHTATLLTNGIVLIAGGISGTGQNTNSVDLYNPTNGAWTVATPMSIGRHLHTATLLRDGTVLITGGISYSPSLVYVSSVELYNPMTGTWTMTNSLSQARANHTATLLPDGKVLIAGGASNTTAIATAETYDPTTGTWKTVGSMSAARYYHTATLLLNGKVLVAGGRKPDLLANGALYDPISEAWTDTGPLNTPRYLHTATLLPSGKVLIAGGFGGAYLTSSELFIPPVSTTTILLTNVTKLPNGAFQFAFTNAAGAAFTALASTNVSLPLINWTPLGAVTEISSGNFQFTDSQAMMHSQRFYAVRAN